MASFRTEDGRDTAAQQRYIDAYIGRSMVMPDGMLMSWRVVGSANHFNKLVRRGVQYISTNYVTVEADV